MPLDMTRTAPAFETERALDDGAGAQHRGDVSTTTGMPIAPRESSEPLDQHEHERICRCTCGHPLRVFGGGRHRIYFELEASPENPVVNGVCPACGRGLPGKSPS